MLIRTSKVMGGWGNLLKKPSKTVEAILEKGMW
jgi:hypothetical protein